MLSTELLGSTIVEDDIEAVVDRRLAELVRLCRVEDIQAPPSDKAGETPEPIDPGNLVTSEAPPSAAGTAVTPVEPDLSGQAAASPIDGDLAIDRPARVADSGAELIGEATLDRLAALFESKSTQPGLWSAAATGPAPSPRPRRASRRDVIAGILLLIVGASAIAYGLLAAF